MRRPGLATLTFGEEPPTQYGPRFHLLSQRMQESPRIFRVPLHLSQVAIRVRPPPRHVLNGLVQLFDLGIGAARPLRQGPVLLIVLRAERRVGRDVGAAARVRVDRVDGACLTCVELHHCSPWVGAGVGRSSVRVQRKRGRHCLCACALGRGSESMLLGRGVSATVCGSACCYGMIIGFDLAGSSFAPEWAVCCGTGMRNDLRLGLWPTTTSTSHASYSMHPTVPKNGVVAPIFAASYGRGRSGLAGSLAQAKQLSRTCGSFSVGYLELTGRTTATVSTSSASKRVQHASNVL
ncbi:hypothetical protein C8Q76DRAFT_425215 [Earliella scabrosa]|nr:hypothetical protein C8Q76DRAFT_425215 [Earliella scabrosa]